MKTKKTLSIDEQIKAEQERLESIFSNIESDKRAINQKLISNAAFMAVTLQSLQDKVNSEGAVITAVNGNGFETINEHPAQKSYNTMINRYTAVIKQLTDLISKDQPTEIVDELMEFIRK